MRLKNEQFKNSFTCSAFGVLKYDEQGFVIEPELTEEQMKALAVIKGFEIVEDEKDEKKKQVKQDEKEAEAESSKAKKGRSKK